MLSTGSEGRYARMISTFDRAHMMTIDAALPRDRNHGSVRELFAQIARFLSAGGIAVAAQWLLLIALVELDLLHPVPASCLGFAAATSLSYFLRRRFVFKSRLAHRHCLPRYTAVAMAALGLTALIMTMGTHLLALPYLAAQLLTSAIVTSWNFTAHRAWTFRAPADGGADPAGTLATDLIA